MAYENIEFIDCGSLSISYDATGKASVSLTVVRDDRLSLQKQYDNKRWGGVQFDLIVMSAVQSPIIGSGGWNQWSLQMEGVAN
jgi:hypothetical protein